MYATKSTSIEYDPCPAGMHHAVCYRVIDLGTQETEWQGTKKKQHKVMISWELPNELMEPYTDNEGKEHPARPFTVHKKYTLSFHEKAALLKDLNSWRGRPFTDDELSGPPNGFHMSNIVGANCFLNVIHNPSENGKVYANIAAVAPLSRGMDTVEPTNQKVFFDLTDKDTYDDQVFLNLSQGLQETIKASPQFQKIHNPNYKEPTETYQPVPPTEAYEMSDAPF